MYWDVKWEPFVQIEGGSIRLKDFDAFSAESGIKHQCTVSHTPQQNGIPERKNMSLMDTMREMVYLRERTCLSCTVSHTVSHTA